MTVEVVDVVAEAVVTEEDQVAVDAIVSEDVTKTVLTTDLLTEEMMTAAQAEEDVTIRSQAMVGKEKTSRLLIEIVEVEVSLSTTLLIQ